MWEFLQTYGFWILLIVLLILMLRIHGMGGGCCMGMDHDQHEQPRDKQRVVPLRAEDTDVQPAVPLDEYTGTQQAMPFDAAYSDAERRALLRSQYPGAQSGALVRDVPVDEESTSAERYSTAS